MTSATRSTTMRNLIKEIDMKQSNLDAVHQVIVDTVQMWASGLTTDNELCDALHGIHLSFTQYRNRMTGLIDPNTGLRYESPKDN